MQKATLKILTSPSCEQWSPVIFSSAATGSKPMSKWEDLGVLGRPQALLPAGMLASSPLSVVGREKKDHLKALIQLEFTMPGPGYPREKSVVLA